MSFLPTRDGDEVGKAQEFAMGELVGGYDEIRTVEWQNGDGSVTRLRTRGGWPIFETEGGGVAKLCLATGPLEERPEGYGVPVDMFTLRLQHDPDPLVSSDGIFTVTRRPLKKWSAVFGETLPYKWAEFYFSYKGSQASIITPRAGAVQFVESSWYTRLWYPLQTAALSELGLIFLVARLRQITFNTCELRFNWAFSADGDPSTSASPGARMNQDGEETGLLTRELYDENEIKQFSLILGEKLGVVRTAPPGGFLDALEQSIDMGGASEVLLSDSGDVLSSLSYATAFGQPWHGLLTQSGIETRVGPVVTPSAYTPPVANDADTFYFKRPDISIVSWDAPSDFTSRGMEYLNDAVFFGTNKRYSPLSTCTFELGSDKWLHCDSFGAVRLLRLEPCWVNPDGSAATIRIHNVGLVTTRGVIGPSVQIAEFGITSPDVRTIPNGVYPGGIARWHQGGTFSQAFVSSQSASPMGLNYTFPLNASPSGDRVLIAHYRTHASNIAGPWRDLMIVSVWEVTFSDDLSSYSTEQVWAVDNSNPSAATPGTYSGYYYVHSFHHMNYIATVSHEGVDYPLYDVFYSVHVHAEFSTLPTVATYTMALMAAYTKEGVRSITEYELSWDGTSTFSGTVGDWETHDYTAESHSALTLDGWGGEPGWPGCWGEYYFPNRADFDARYIGRHLGGIAGSYLPSFNTFKFISPNFTWPEQTEPGVMRYSSNLLLVYGGAYPLPNSTFIATEVTKNALELGPVATGFACYNPRDKSITWRDSMITCI